MENPALKALEKAGNRAEEIGQKFTQADMSLKRTTQLVDLFTDASLKLHDLRQKTLNSPEFFSDPEGTANQFAEQTKALQEEYLGNIKDPSVLAHFKKHFGSEALSVMDHVSDAAVAQSRHMSAGDLRNSIIKLTGLADQAPSEQEGLKVLGQAVGVYGRMEAFGLIKPEERVKEVENLTSKWAERRIRKIAIDNPDQALSMLADKTGLASMLKGEDPNHLMTFAESRRDHLAAKSREDQRESDKKHMEAENNAAYVKIRQDFHLDDPSRAAWDDARNYIQANPQATGLSVDPVTQAMKISGDIETQRKQRKATEEDRVKGANDALMHEVLTKDNVSVDRINTYKDQKGVEADSKGREAAIRWVNSDESKRNRTEPELYGKLVSDIGGHRVTDPAELNQYLANGLGKSDYHQLRNMIDTERDPEKAPSLAYAKVAFTTRYPNTGTGGGQIDPKAEVGYARFITQYERMVREQGLKGIQAHDLADKMLQDVDKKVIGSWHGWSTGTALEYYQSWGAWPEPDLTAEPTATPATNLTRKPEDPLGIHSEPKPDPRIADRIKALSGKYTPEQIRGFLKEKKLDPELYGIKGNPLDE
jgi:hypothetical protein